MREDLGDVHEGPLDGCRLPESISFNEVEKCKLLLEFGFQTALAFACFCRGFLVQGEEEGGAAAVVVAAFVAVCRIDGFV